eukprot:3824470-Pleurochrysis_carterae.AAC.1
MPNHEAGASFASRLTFSWLSPLLARGAKRPLEHADLLTLLPVDSTARNAGALGAALRLQRLRGQPVSVFGAMRHAFGAYFWTTGLMKFINDVFIFVNPVRTAPLTASPRL